MKHDYPLKNLTTMKVGGPAKYFLNVKSERNLIKTIEWANKKKIRWYIVGDGSNLIPADNGFDGLIIKNEIKEFKKNGNKVLAGAGNNLLKIIKKLNWLGLEGMEKMAGIPGTVGGAIYGCAGAYGQEIKDCLVKVKVLILPLGSIRWLSKKQCRFGYRESIFKNKKNWIILGAEFKFKKRNQKELSKISKEIIKLREQKYQPGLLCPGSFFKNIVVKEIKPKLLRENFLSKIPPDKIIHGKVPAGYILEEAGARGMKIGDIKVAGHHGNLIYNLGRGKSSDIVKLAKILKEKVMEKFGINLNEEIQYI